MARFPAFASSRRVAAVLVGHDRVSLRREAGAEVEVFHAAGEQFAEAELQGILEREQATLGSRIAVAFEPELEVFTTERLAPGESRGSLIERLRMELGTAIVGREVETPLSPDRYGTVLLLPSRGVGEVQRGLRSGGNRVVRIVSASHAAFDGLLARKRCGKIPEIRVALGRGHGIAMYALEGRLVMRHCFRFGSSPGLAVVAAVRRLQGIARESLEVETAPLVRLHLPADAEVDPEEVAAETGVPVEAAPAVLLTADFLCEAVVRHAFHARERVEIFGEAHADARKAPLKAALGMALSLGAVGLWIQGKAAPLDAEIAALENESSPVTARFGDDALVLQDLAERLRLGAAVTSAFVADRASWAPILSAVADDLPEEARLVSVAGAYPFQFSEDEEVVPRGGEDGDSYLDLGLVLPISGGAETEAAAVFSEALAADPVIAARFPDLRGASVERRDDHDHPHVRIEVRALPR